MTVRNWWSRLFSRNSSETRRSRRKLERERRLRFEPRIERLEDRLAPATVITVQPGAAGTGSLDTFLSAADGTLAATDNPGVAGTLSTGALAAVGPTVNISITAEDSIVFNNIGNFSVQTGAGNSVGFIAQTTAVTFGAADTVNTAGASLAISAATDLSVAGLNASGGNITLTASGAIKEAGAGLNKVTATNLALSAGTGIGTSALALATTVSILDANTVTGGIFLSNSGDLSIGAALNGLRVTGASGDIQLVNQGSITVDIGDHVIRGPNNITVQALGSGSDIRTGAQTNFNAIRSTVSGAVSVQSGRDILMGDAAGFGDIVSASGSVTINAGRDLVVDFDSELRVDAGISDLTVNAGRNISVLATSGAAFVQNAGSGQIILTTGAGGAFTASSGSSIGDVQSNGGNIVVAADNITLTDSNSLNAGAGRVTLAPVASGRAIDLGTKTAGTLGLTQAELNSITAGVLQVGSATAGAITVSANIGPFANVNTLTLINNSTITFGPSGFFGSIATPLANLRVSSTGPVVLANASNVGTLAAATTGAFTFSNGNNLLTVGIVDGVTGIATSNAAITLLADNLTLSQQVNSGTAATILVPASTGRPTTLGTKPGTSLGLLALDLNNITAGVLQIGSTTTYTGSIDVTANTTAPATWSTLRLFSLTGTVTQSGGSLAVTNLVPNAGGGVTLNNFFNPVSAIWGGTNGTSNTFSFLSSGDLTIGGPSPGNTQGIKTGGGAVIVSALGNLSVVGAVGVDTTNVGAVPAGANVTLASLSDVTVSAPINGGSTGAVKLTSGAGNLGSTMNIGAAVTGASAQLNGGNGNDAFVINPVGSSLFTIDGAAGSNTLHLGAFTTPLTWNITAANTGNVTGVATSFTNIQNLIGGTVADNFVFSDAASITGTIDGGAGTDTLDYSAYTTAISANLGSNSPLIASLDGEQQVPPSGSAATGTANLAYDNVAHTFDISMTVSNLSPANVTAMHLHVGAFGVNGPIIVPFNTALIVPSGSGFTFTQTGLSLPPSDEAALLGGFTYVNIRTTAFPGGEIRGQVFDAAAFVVLATGTATGTAGISNIENATGGSAGDSLVGNINANTLIGNAGDDFIVGARGNDTMSGGANDDSMSWNNGDGSDIIDGGAGTNTVQVNGAVAAGDAFVVSPGVVGRVNFQRTNLGTFALDIGTVQTLNVVGSGGDDALTVNDLTGVANLTAVNFAGMAGNNTLIGPNANTTWNATAANRGNFSNAGIAVNYVTTQNLTGGTANDSFVLAAAGSVSGTVTGGTAGSDSLNNVATPGSSVSVGGAGTNHGFLGIATGVGAFNNIDTFTTNTTGVVVNGTGGNDSLTLVNNAGTVQYVLNGAAPVIVPAGATQFTFNGIGGNDVFTVDYSGGAIPFNITDNGTGTANSKLAVKGDGATTNATYLPDAVTNGNGTVTINGAQVITFIGLKPVDMSGMATATVTFPNPNVVANIANGFDFATGTMPALIISGTSGGVGFETVAAFNNANLVLDSTLPGGDDAFTITSGNNAHANTNVSILTGTGADAISINGFLAVTGNVTLQSGGSITEAGAGRIGANVLTTNSTTGTSLTGGNAVATFNATNTVSGDITLTNGFGGPLTITGISQSGGGNVVINSGFGIITTGAITTTADGSITLNANHAVTIGAAVTAGGAGGVTLSAAGALHDITLNATVSSTSGNIAATAGRSIFMNAGSFTTAGNVTLTGSTSIVAEQGSGVISAALLTVSAVGGINLGGANTVTSFNATNSGAATLGFTNTAGLLTITGINMSGGGSGLVNQTGALAATGPISSTANGNISLFSTGTQNIGAAIAAGGSGAVFLSATGAGADIVISSALSSVSGGITAVANRNVTINAAGSITTTGTVTLTGTAGFVNETGTGGVSANLLTVNSATGATLSGANAATMFIASNSTSGDITLTNTKALLTTISVIQSGGGNVAINQTGALTITANGVTTAANGNITLNATGTLTVDAAVTAGGSGSINLSATGAGSDIAVNANVKSTSGGIVATANRNFTLNGAANFNTTGNVTLTGVTGSVSETGTGSIGAALLTTSSVGGTTLTTGNGVAGFNATNSGSGNITLNNTSFPLTISGVNQSGGGDLTVANTGSVVVSGAVNVAGAGGATITTAGANSDITLNAAITSGSGNVVLTAIRNIILSAGGIATAGNATLTAGRAIAETGAGAIGAALLTTSSAGGTFLDAGNTVASFNATNSVSGNISLTNTAATLTITGISQTGGGNVAVGNTGALTTTGAVTTAANGNILLLASATETINAVVTAGGSGAILLSATGAASDLAINAAVSSATGSIVAVAGRNFTLNGANNVTTTGNVSLTGTAGTVSETGTGFVSANLLTTSSMGGTTLNAANTVSQFNAANTGSGNIALTNTAASLSVTGVAQSGGGDLIIANTGSIALNGAANIGGAGNASLTAAGAASDVTFNATLSAATGNVVVIAGRNIVLAAGNVTTAGNVALTATAGSITETGAGAIGAALLTTTSVGGTILTAGNTVAAFNATNSGSGNITLINTAATLTITGITETGGGNVIVTNTGNVVITGTISGGGGNATLNATGSIAETGAGAIAAALLTTNSGAGTALDGANTVTSFNATNTVGGNMSLNNTAATLTVTGISQSGGGNVAVVNAGNIVVAGAVTIGGAGNAALTASGAASDISLNANLTGATGNLALTAGRNVVINAGNITTAGAVTLTGIAGNITEAGAGIISGALLTTSSVGGTTLGNNNTVSSFNATNTGGGNISLANTAATLTITGISQTGGGNVNVGNVGGITNTGAITTAANGNILLLATGDLVIGAVVTAGGSGGILLSTNGAANDLIINATINSGTGNIVGVAGRNVTLTVGSLTTGGDVNLTGASGAVTEKLSGIINAALLTTVSATGTILNSANTVTSFNGTNTVSGSLALNNTATTLTVTGITQVVGGNVFVNNAGGVTTTGTVNGGNVTINATNTISLGANVTAPGGTILLLTTLGGASQTAGSLSGVNLLLLGNGAFALNGPGNANNINTLAAAVLGSITFHNTTGLTIGTVGATNGITTGNGATNGGAVIINDDVSITVNQAISTAAGTGGTLTIGNGVTINAAITAGAGNIVLNGGAANPDLLVCAPLTSASTISLTALRDVIICSTVTTTGAAADIIVTADSDNNGVGGVWIQNMSPAQIGILNSARDISVFGAALFTPPNTGSSLFVDAGTSLIAGRNITLQANAVAPINASMRINGNVTSTAGGNILIGNTGAVSTQGNLTTTANGNISVTTQGTEVFGGALTTAGSGAITLLAVGAGNSIVLQGGATTGSGAITVTAGAHIVQSAGAISTTGNITLTSATAGGVGLIVQDGGTISTPSLTTSSRGGTLLYNGGVASNPRNTVSTFMATNALGGDINLVNTALLLTLGGINQSGGGDVLIDNAGSIEVAAPIQVNNFGDVIIMASGFVSTGNIGVNATIQSVNGNITLCGFQIGINAAVNAGTGTIRINAFSSVSQTGTGILTGGGLGVIGASVDLGLDNLISGTLSIIASGAIGSGGAVTFVNNANAALTIGTIAAAPCYLQATNGVTSNNAAITVVNKLGDLILLQPISTGAPVATVRLLAGGGIVSAAATGTITADALGVRAAGNITLNQANLVNTFSAASTSGSITFNDVTTGRLTIGATAAQGAFTPGTAGVSTGGPLFTLTTAGSLLVNQPLSVPAGNIVLNVAAAQTGNVTIDNTTVTALGTSLFMSTPGLTNDESLVVNNPAGGLFLPSGSFNFFAQGGGNHFLSLNGGGSAALVDSYTVGGGNPNFPIGTEGSFVFSGQINSSLTFVGVNQDILDNITAGTQVINGTDIPDLFNLSDGGTDVAGRDLLGASFTGFQKLLFAQKTNIVVNTQASNQADGDTVNVNFNRGSTGLQALTINGSNAGDTINLDGIRNPAGGALTAVVINSGGSGDVINVNGVASSSAVVVINGGVGNDTITVNNPGAFAGLTANGEDGDDVFNIFNTPAGATSTFNGGLGRNTFNVGNGNLDTILGPVAIVGGSSPTTTMGQDCFGNPITVPVGNTIVIDDSAKGQVTTYTLNEPDNIPGIPNTIPGTSTSVVTRVQDGAPTTVQITYLQIAELDLTAGTANDTVNVQPSVTTFFALNGGGNTGFPGNALNVNLINPDGSLITDANFLKGNIPNSGVFTFTQGSHQPICFQNFQFLKQAQDIVVSSTVDPQSPSGFDIQIKNAQLNVSAVFTFPTTTPFFLTPQFGAPSARPGEIFAPRIATGDVTGDNLPDIIVGAPPGNGNTPTVFVFDGAALATAAGSNVPVNLPLIAQFNAYDPNFTGGVNVAVGKVMGNDRSQIVTAPAVGGGPNVKVFEYRANPGGNITQQVNPVGGPLASFFAFNPNFSGGVNLAVGDVNADGRADIIAAPAAGGGPNVTVYSGASNGIQPDLIDSFFAYDPNFTGGVVVGAGNFDKDGFADIVTGPAFGGSSDIKIFSGANLGVLAEFIAFPPATGTSSNVVTPFPGNGAGLSGAGGVAFVDLNGNGILDVAVGAGSGDFARVRVFDGAALLNNQPLRIVVASTFIADYFASNLLVADSFGDPANPPQIPPGIPLIDANGNPYSIDANGNRVNGQFLRNNDPNHLIGGVLVAGGIAGN